MLRIRSAKGESKKIEITKRKLHYSPTKIKRSVHRRKKERLSELNKQVIRAYVKNGMNVGKTAASEYMTRATVYFHLRELEKFTGLKYSNKRDKKEIRQRFGDTIWRET